MFFGLGEKTWELFRMLRVLALTHEQCNEICNNGVYRLQGLGWVKRCPHCHRYEADHELIERLNSKRIGPVAEESK